MSSISSVHTPSVGGRGPSGQARPGRRAFWADARFVIGLLLVAASIAGVWFVVGAARQTTPLLAASGTLVPGQTITSADVTVVEVALGQAQTSYLTPEALGDGLVALRPIGAGELLPTGGVGGPDRSDRTSVMVRSSVDVPADVARGAAVELWESRPAAEPGVYETPRILVSDAVVAAVNREDGVMASGGASLELVIDRAHVADVLSAIAAGSVLSAVPTTGGGQAMPPGSDSASDPAAGGAGPAEPPAGEDGE